MTVKVLRLLAAWGLAAAAQAHAAPLDDWQRTGWTAAEGAPERIETMAQTLDGWLWLGTHDGLFRFDGQRFERVALKPGPGLGHDRIFDLYAAPNGDLYLGFHSEGIAVVHPDGKVDRLPPQAPPLAPVGAMALDGDGSLWTIGDDVRHLHGGRWETVARGPAWQASQAASMLRDGRGELWAALDRSAWRLDRASGRFVQVADSGGELLLAPDGGVWLAERGAAPRALSGPGGGGVPPGYGQATSHWAGQFDAAGALWRLNCPQPDCLAAHAMLEDREGDLWLATDHGLERLRRNRIVRAGLPGGGARYSLATDGAGQAWAADHDSGQLLRLQPDGPPVPEPGRKVSLVANGRDGALLIGDPRAIERSAGGRSERIALPPGPDGKPRDHHLFGVLDDGKVLWTSSYETGLIGWRDGQWLPRRAFNLPDKIYQSAPAGVGQLWLATGDGELVFYDDPKPDAALPRWDIRAVGEVSAIFPGAPLTVSGNGGFGVLWHGRLRMLRGADPDALRNLTGMVVTPDGDYWLNGAAGVVHVRAADWRRSMDDPDQPLRYEVFGALDGYPGQAVLDTRWPSARSADGRNLWLAATGGVVRLDTGALRRNAEAPRPSILGVAAGKERYPAGAMVVLPPGSGQFGVQFTAPALRMPERARFEYRLDGVDGEWQDGGTRRTAWYAGLAPGDYVFRVRAFNEDGAGGAPEAVTRLRIEPTVTQTLWFKLACAAACALLAALLYRYRVRQLTARLTERLQVRTAERERIARTLHDSFLQTVQGLVLRVDAAAAALAPGDPARRQLERVLDDAGSAIREGRAQLQELRAGDAHVLEDVAADAVAQLRSAHGPMAAELRIEGELRALAPAVSEDIAAILREALRNAFAHSGGSQVWIGIQYGPRRLVVRVADDGQGIDGDVLRAGRPGHWGLAGMRERAQRIGARLDIDAGRRHGTTVTLSVPAACAYAGPAPADGRRPAQMLR